MKSVMSMFYTLLQRKAERISQAELTKKVMEKKSQEKSENLIDALYICEQRLGGHLFSFIPPGKSAVGDAVRSLTNSGG